jgi:hypothetical protein
MLKELKRYQVRLTPFQAVKNWALNNTENESVLLFESTGSDDGEQIDLEYIDWGTGGSSPNTSSECEIALEQQDADQASYREGASVTGPFYPETDPVNVDGTYQRSVYSQVKISFYNTFRDPTKIWGLENIDFEKGKTKRRLADRLRMFDIPRRIFGDKILPSTVVIRDTSLDNDYTIEDDGYGNLTARRNLFSKQQEIGDFTNDFLVGAEHTCDDYLMLTSSTSPISLGNWESITINWEAITSNWEVV